MLDLNKAGKLEGLFAQSTCYKQQLFSFSQKVESFFDQLKTISYQDLTLTRIEENTCTFECHLNLPVYLQAGLKQLRADMESFPNAYQPYAHQLLWGHSKPVEHTHNPPNPGMDPALYLTLYIDKTKQNRIHVLCPGLNPGFQRKGIGRKIYRKMISELGYVSSEQSTANDFLVWQTLFSDPDLYVFLGSDVVIAFRATAGFETVYPLISQVFGLSEPGEYLLDSDFVAHYSGQLLQTEFKHYLSSQT
jgi:ribosomal protein S18 acetylase RimI-like enzyme